MVNGKLQLMNIEFLFKARNSNNKLTAYHLPFTAFYVKLIENNFIKDTSEEKCTNWF